MSARNQRIELITRAWSARQRQPRQNTAGRSPGPSWTCWRRCCGASTTAAPAPASRATRAIADKAECARSTVAEALKALEWAGVLTWQNRIARIQVRERDLFGQWASRWRVIRASNAYVFSDPKPQLAGVFACKSENATGTRNQEFLIFDWHPRATPTAHWSVPTLTQRLCHLRSFAWPTALALHSRVHLPPSFGDQPFGECFDTAFLAVIAHAVLGGRPPLPSRGEQAPAEDPAAAEERARMMEAIALSVFWSQATAGAAPHWVRCVRTSPRALAACALVRSEFAFVRGVPRGRSCASARFWAGPAAPTQDLHAQLQTLDQPGSVWPT